MRKRDARTNPAVGDVWTGYVELHGVAHPARVEVVGIEEGYVLASTPEGLRPIRTRVQDWDTLVGHLELSERRDGSGSWFSALVLVLFVALAAAIVVLLHSM